MNAQLEQNNFLLVPSFISQERAQALNQEFFILERDNKCTKDGCIAAACVFVRHVAACVPLRSPSTAARSPGILCALGLAPH